MSDQMIHLAVDLLGADTPEEELCRGAVRALVGNPALFLHLCGHADVLSAVTAEIGAAEIAGRYEIVDAPVALSNNEDPMQAYQRTDASLCAAMRLAHEGAAGGVITCGATGAVLVTSIMILGKLPRLRPILAVELTNPAGEPLLLLDCGANIDSRPELYPAFAHLGDAYMRCIGCSSPRIALLSNGAEAKKGCEAVKAAHALLAEQPFRFVGNIEATSAPSPLKALPKPRWTRYPRGCLPPVWNPPLWRTFWRPFAAATTTTRRGELFCSAFASRS